jgi:hypothetical protein
VVWKLLVDAKNWLSYFSAEDQAKIQTGDLKPALGTTFPRVKAGFPISLIITEYDPFRRLAWSTTVDNYETDSNAYHGWVITPTSDGCHADRRDAAGEMIC